MTIYQQQTDYRTSRSYPFSVRPVDETVSGRFVFCTMPLSNDTALIDAVFHTICQVKNQQVRDQAVKLLAPIQEMFRALQQSGVDLSYLPPLRATNVDDRSVLIEWVFADFRVGFSIEPNPDNSSWYLVSDKRLDEVSAFGYLSNANLEKTVSQLFGFVLANA
jgi:hypothetical protein